MQCPGRRRERRWRQAVQPAGLAANHLQGPTGIVQLDHLLSLLTFSLRSKVSAVNREVSHVLNFLHADELLSALREETIKTSSQ